MTERSFPSSVLGTPGRRQGLRFSFISLFVTLLFAQSIILVTPEILGLNMMLYARSDEVHFVRGFLQAPASIDLSNMIWRTTEDIFFDIGDDAYEYGYDDDTAYDTTPPSFTEQETDLPASNQEDFAGGSITGENEDKALEGGDGDDEKDDEEESISDEENVEPSDPIIPTEDNENNAKDTDSDSENVSEPLTSVIEPGDNKTDGDKTSAIDENDKIQGTDDIKGKDGIAEDPTAESIGIQNPDDENNDDGSMEEKEGEIINEEEDDMNDNQDQQRPVPGIPSEEEDDIEGEEENGGKANEEGSGDEYNQEEEEFTLVTPSGDKNNNEDDEVNVEGGNNKSNEQNDGGGEQPNENQNESSDVASATERVTKESTFSPTVEDKNPTGFGGDRSLLDTSSEASTATNQILEFALFLIPADCKRDEWGDCDWVTLGVGSYDDEMEGGMSYCCSKNTADRGICNSKDIGTIMINHENFKGDHRNIMVPSQPGEEFQMDYPFFNVEKSGDHVLVIANCNEDGLGILTVGTMEWKSVGGYLPGDMFGLMFFYGAMTAVYLVLGLWYYYGMKIFQEAAIPIQKYILCTIILGFLETASRGIDLYYWNITGVRSPVVMYNALALGTLFQGCLRCLGVMVAMGWGVVRDTLGMTLGKIIMLGLLYSGLSLLRDSLEAAASSAHFVSSRQEEEYGLAQVLYFVIIIINIIFYYWIIISFKSTTEYLRNMNQTSKLRRHLRLRCLIITSLIIISILTVVNALQSLAGKSIFQFRPFLSEDQTWIINAVGYGNYLFILFGVTILWRPNAQAKDYAMQMQLPAVSDDANDLELSCVVPSADDMDMGEGYKIDDAVVT